MDVQGIDRGNVEALANPQFEVEWYEQAVRIRDKRRELFGSDVTMDPAWDIVLVLANPAYVAGATFHQIAMGVPVSPETVCRWLRILIDRKHVEQVSAEVFRLSVSSRKGLPDVFA